MHNMYIHAYISTHIHLIKLHFTLRLKTYLCQHLLASTAHRTFNFWIMNLYRALLSYFSNQQMFAQYANDLNFCVIIVIVHLQDVLW